MKEKIIAKRYGDAFVSYTKGVLSPEAAAKELKNLKNVIVGNVDFQKFLENQEIFYIEKCKVIDIVLRGFSGQTRQFLKFILEKQRIKNIAEICDYVRNTYSHTESIDALLKTTYPLGLDLVRRIKEKLEIKFKRKILLHIELDATLLGGVCVTVGNTIIDGSSRRQLDEIKERLIGTGVN